MWTIGQSLVMRQTLSESRTVADMVENIGRWASQYGGVHAKTVGTDAKIPGNFLTRSVYTVNSNDAGVLQGALVPQHNAEQAALGRVEAYHWKNPALICAAVSNLSLPPIRNVTPSPWSVPLTSRDAASRFPSTVVSARIVGCVP